MHCFVKSNTQNIIAASSRRRLSFSLLASRRSVPASGDVSARVSRATSLLSPHKPGKRVEQEGNQKRGNVVLQGRRDDGVKEMSERFPSPKDFVFCQGIPKNLR